MKQIPAPNAIATRLVHNQRWIHRNEIRQGMYVLELDVPWENTDFIFQGFALDTRELVEAVQRECDYALVKMTKMARYSPWSVARFSRDALNNSDYTCNGKIS